MLAAIGGTEADRTRPQPAATVFAIEIDRVSASSLPEARFARRNPADICQDVLQADFLECDGLGSFDRIVTIRRLRTGTISGTAAALRLLSLGGRMVAVCANGPRQQDKLRLLVQQRRSLWVELPADTFSVQEPTCALSYWHHGIMANHIALDDSYVGVTQKAYIA